MAGYIIVTAIIIYFIFKIRILQRKIKTLKEKNENLEKQLTRSFHECNKKSEQILYYKRNLGIKGRYSLFDCLPKDEL